MAESIERKVVHADQNNKRKTAKICEYLTYSGREAYKRLRTNVMIALSESEKKRGHVLGITSAQASEGKSSTSTNLAYSFAELGSSVLLIDCDMRRPAIHENVGAKLSPGLSDVLQGDENLGNAIVRYQSSTDSTWFDVLAGGTIPDHPLELLNSSRFQKLVEVVSGAYDYVIIDLPPVGPVVDAVTVSKCTDGIILVVRENHCPRFMLADCVEQLRYAKTNILGFVMNGCVEGAGKRYQYSSQYAYRSDR